MSVERAGNTARIHPARVRKATGATVSLSAIRERPGGVMTTATISEEEIVLESAPLAWWVYLVFGAVWLTFGWVVLSARHNTTTVWAVTIYTGCLFFIVGMGEIVESFFAIGYRWVHALLGIVSVIAGVIVFAWPNETFLTLAVLLSWFLLIHGTVGFVAALAGRHEFELWWMRLIVSIIEVMIGFWAIGYPGRSIVLLIIWVGATALAKGIGNIIEAFELRSLRHNAAS
jgi:uncharacterized membrane protein HdeD (DUF308 family)